MNTNATEARLREIAERENKATKGPWRFSKCGDKSRGAEWFIVAGDDGKECSVLPGIEAFDDLPERPNSVFLVNSRQDVPWLLALIKKQREALEHIEKCGEFQCNQMCAKDYIPRRKHAPDCPIEYLEAARDALNFSPEKL